MIGYNIENKYVSIIDTSLKDSIVYIKKLVAFSKEQITCSPQTAKTLTRSGGGLGAKEKSERSARLRGKSGPTKAQSMAKARMRSKSRMSGSRSGGKR